MPTAGAIVQSAMLESNIIASGETMDAADAAWGLEKLQRLIDQINAQRELIYNVNFAQYTLTPNHNPHTIGPSGDFNVAVRPVKIVACSLILSSGGTAVDLPRPVRDDAWYASLALKNMTSTLFTDVYYSPDFPLGNLYFWPIPTTAVGARLETWSSLVQPPTLNSQLSFPQGYWEFLVLTLAVKLLSSFEKPPNPILVSQQREAQKAIESNNAQSPRIATMDAGMPNSTRNGRPDFNFLDGTPW